MKKQFFHFRNKKAGAIKIAALLILLLIQHNNVQAQQPLPCGPEKMNMAEFQKALAFEKNHILAPQSAGAVLNVYFHICCYDDGSNAAARTTQVDSEFNILVSEYANDNICFINAGVNFIFSTALDTFFVGTNDASLFNPYQVSNCVNVFYLLKIGGNNGACHCGYGGIALGGIPGTYCLIAKGNINEGQTIAHEVGHCLGLLHTFEPANGYEDIDGTNGSTSADLIPDTQADPYAYNDGNHTCYSTSGCLYNGSCADPKGKTNFSPPYTNLMAYWWALGNCYPSLALTTDQYARVNSFINTSSIVQSFAAPASNTVSNLIISSGNLVETAINTCTTSGTVSITGTANVTLGGQTTFLEPGFDALPSSGGEILVRAEDCSSSPALLEANIPLQENTSLLAYPNPTNGNLNLDFGLGENQGQVVIQVFDMNLRKVKEIPLGALSSGKQHVSMSLADLPAALYTIILRSSTVFLTTKVIVTK